MKKYLLILLMFLGIVSFAIAQRTITGTVKDGNGDPMVGASILVKGTTVGNITDVDGKFAVAVPATAQTLIISFAGFESQEVTLGASNIVDVRLGESTLAEIVISALNVRRSEKSLPYAHQSVKSDELAVIRPTNLNNALAGKIAGVQVRSQSVAALGRSGAIRIRGAGSLTDKEPLYVIDGTPVVNSSDLNVDDVENVTVLKGPSATAIYGQRGDAGVILVTTKRAKKTPGIGIEVAQSTFWDKVYILPRYQNNYAGGDGDWQVFKWEAGMPTEWKALDGKKHHDYSDDASWGPKIDGSEHIPWYAWYPGTQYSFKTEPITGQPNNVRDFYDTGVTANTNIAFSKVGDSYSTRFSITNQNTKGLTPTTSLNKYIISTQNSIDLGKYFTLGVNLNYVKDKLTGLIDDAYANQTSGSFGSWFHRNLDMSKVKELKGLKSPEGYLSSWNHNNPGAYLASPLDFYGGNYWYNFFAFNDNLNRQLFRNRLFGDVNLTFKLNDKFKIAGFIRKDQISRDYEYKGKSILEQSATQTGFHASYETGQSIQAEDNYEALATYSDRFGSLSVEANAGGNIRKDKLQQNLQNTVDGLVIPDLFTLGNSVTTPIGINDFRRYKEVRSLYARGSFGFKDMLYLDWSARNDWSSALPTETNSYFYPSLGGSFVFSELIKNVPALSYGKVRFGWAKVGSDIAAYLINTTFPLSTKWGSDLTMVTPNELPDPAIKPSLSSSIEGGFDLRFFRNRLGLSFTYYNEDKKDEILSIPVSGTSGYSSKLINAASMNRKGIEIALSATPVKMQKFNWDINLNFAQNTSTIDSLAPGTQEYIQETGTFGTSSGVRLVHKNGVEWGQLRGGGFRRDANGNKIVDAGGLFVVAQNTYLGSVLPDFTGGFLNTFSYGDIVANINIDFQKGGKFFSLSDAWGTFSGLTERTGATNDKGKDVRAAVADGGGVHVVAVTADGKPFDKYVDAYAYFHQFRGRRIAEEHIYDLDFVKMRELSIGYRLPVAKMGLKGIQNVTLSLVARNPWLIYAKTKDFDPSEISNTYGENGQLPGTRSFGFNVKVGF